MNALKKPYVVFRLQNVHYAVEASTVWQIIWICSLRQVKEVSDYVVGALNLRGKVVYVFDLALKMGLEHFAYGLSDIIIVTETKGNFIGVIANEIIDIIDIALDALESTVDADKFIKYIAKVEDELIMVIEPGRLLLRKSSANVAHLNSLNFSPKELEILQNRTKALNKMRQAREAYKRISLCVVGIGGEFFAIELRLICEFANIKSLEQVPCCPNHIAGNMNLRGEIITIIDVSGFLNLPPKAAINNTVIVKSNEMVLGILIDDVYDVLNVLSEDISTTPLVGRNHNEQYLKATVGYSKRSISVIDVERLLLSEGLIVDEEV
ncbi:MAG: chemotaxis protein CheW [Candidatus Magnetoovum sp. WYHC-5]|nr:chemotaxis protein CheW [Candidatus Magnetoovum sp. WYHC-5]